MGCGRMMVGGVLLCAMASAFLLAQSAPTTSSSKSSSNELTSHEKPLVRTKRAEDIMYGNPQSSARVKKSDPSAVAASDDEATKTDANALPPEENDRKDDAEQSLPDEKQGDEQEEYGGASNGQNNLEEMPTETVEGVSDGDGDSEPQETARRRRSAEAEALMMTAENMASSAARRTPLRAKRDLDYEELRQLLENSRQAKEEQEEQEEEEQEEEEGDDDDIGLPVDIASVLQETNSEGEEEEEEEDDREDGAVSLVMPYPYAPRVSSEKEELIRELVAEREKEEAKEKVIDYLLAAALTDAESTADDDGGGRFLVEAPVPFDDIGPVAAAAAVKRSALYPYSYEPPHGSRWAEPVSGPKRSRLGEHERLNRLAEALGVYNDYEEAEEK